MMKKIINDLNNNDLSGIGGTSYVHTDEISVGEHHLNHNRLNHNLGLGGGGLT
jgi:hypothetical protein